MLQPKRTKYRKQMKGRNRGLALRGNKVSFGEYGLKATTRGRLTSRQIEAARVAISRHMKKGGKMWLRVFPDKAITKHPAETRMGKGKGAPDHWAVVVRPGRMLFELEGITRAEAEAALRVAAFKLPIRTQFVAREHI